MCVLSVSTLLLIAHYMVGVLPSISHCLPVSYTWLMVVKTIQVKLWPCSPFHSCIMCLVCQSFEKYAPSLYATPSLSSLMKSATNWNKSPGSKTYLILHALLVMYSTVNRERNYTVFFNQSNAMAVQCKPKHWVQSWHLLPEGCHKPSNRTHCNSKVTKWKMGKC